MHNIQTPKNRLGEVGFPAILGFQAFQTMNHKLECCDMF
jgi:hypothetical protein